MMLAAGVHQYIKNRCRCVPVCVLVCVCVIPKTSRARVLVCLLAHLALP